MSDFKLTCLQEAGADVRRALITLKCTENLVGITSVEKFALNKLEEAHKALIECMKCKNKA